MVFALLYLTLPYQAFIREIRREGYSDGQPATQKLELKQKNHFGETLKIEKGKTKRDSLIFRGNMTLEEAVRRNASNVYDINT